MKKRILHALAAGCLALAVSISVLAQPVTAYASLKSSTEEEKRVIFGDFIGEDKHTGVISYPEKKEVIVREDLQNLMLLSKDREHLIYQKTDGGIYTSAPDGADETLIVNGIEEPRSLGIYGDVFWFCDNYVYYTGTTVYSYNLKTKTLTKALENTTHIIGGKYMEREGENLNFYFVDHDSGQMSRVGQCSTKDFGEYVECPYLDFNESGGAMIITGSEKNNILYDDGKTLTLLTDGDSDLISKQFSVCTSDNYLLVSEYNKETMKGKMYLRYKDQKLKDYDLSECYPVYSWLKEGKNGFYTLMSKNDGSYKTYLYWITKDGAMRELMQVNIKNDLSPQIYFLDARFLIYLDESSYLHRAILDEEKIIQDEILLPEAVKSLETRSYNDGSAVVIKGENSYTYLLRNGESPLLSFGMFSNIACMSEDGKKAYWVLESGILRECDLISAENSNPEYYHVSGVMDSGKEISTYIVDSESLTSGLIKGVDPNAFIFRKLESDNAHYGYYYYDGSTASLLTEVAHDGVLD